MTRVGAIETPAGEHARTGAGATRATDPAVRHQWNKTFAYLHAQAKSADPFNFLHELLEHTHRFEAVLHPSYGEILGSPFLWSEAERGFVLWLGESFQGLARTAAGCVRREAAQDVLLSGPAGELAALSLAAFGNAIKWAEISGASSERSVPVEVRRVHEMVTRAGLGGERHAVRRGEMDSTVTLDALFIRAMLLDAICRGNLEPRQVEIVDSWLWEWSGDYAITGSDRGAAVELDAGRSRGSATAAAEPGPRRYIAIDALERHIAGVVRGFRQGEIFPGYGCAAQFRVEEHAAALDFLRRFLQSARYRRARVSRTDREERREALVGLGEIEARAFSPPASPLAADGAGAVHESGLQAPGIDKRYEIQRRYMRVLDESAEGLGVEFSEDPARPIHVGALVTLHQEGVATPVLCEVMRRSSRGMGPTHLGLRILSHRPKKIRLVRPGADGGVDAIYVPGGDASGEVDSLLVSEQDFDTRHNYEVRFDDRMFVIRMNRVRYHGHGWHLAGFEVNEERAPKSPDAAVPLAS
jgi:hypothetical protein